VFHVLREKVVVRGSGEIIDRHPDRVARAGRGAGQADWRGRRFAIGCSVRPAEHRSARSVWSPVCPNTTPAAAMTADPARQSAVATVTERESGSRATLACLRVPWPVSAITGQARCGMQGVVTVDGSLTLLVGKRLASLMLGAQLALDLGLGPGSITWLLGVEPKTGVMVAVQTGYGRQWWLTPCVASVTSRRLTRALRVLPEEVDRQQLEEFGDRHGIPRDGLVSRMGGSP
jgi:hypothetical protein